MSINGKTKTALTAILAITGLLTITSAVLPQTNSVYATTSMDNTTPQATTTEAPQQPETTTTEQTQTTESPTGETTVTETNATTETTTEQPAETTGSTGGEAAPANETQAQPEQQQTPSFMGPGEPALTDISHMHLEAFQIFTEDCLQQLQDAAIEVFYQGIVVSGGQGETPEEIQLPTAIDNATDSVSDIVEGQLPDNVTEDLNDQAQDVVEAIQNASDAGVIDVSDETIAAINDSANAGSIIEDQTQEGIVEAIGDETGATGDITDSIGDGITDVITGDANASEAADAIGEDIEAIGNETTDELTPGEITDITDGMNVSDIVDEITDIAESNDTQQIADSVIDSAIDNATESATSETPAAGGNEQVQTLVTELSNVRDSLSAIIARIGQ